MWDVGCGMWDVILIFIMFKNILKKIRTKHET